MKKSKCLNQRYLELNNKFQGFMNDVHDYWNEYLMEKFGGDTWGYYQDIHPKWGQDLYNLFYKLTMDFGEYTLDELGDEYAEVVKEKLSR